MNWSLVGGKVVLISASLAAFVGLSLGCSARAPPSPSALGGAEAASVLARSPLGIADAGLARWSDVITLPLVPVEAANLPDGTVLLWSSDDPFNYGVVFDRTYTATFNPQTGVVVQHLATETSHDMFCPGTANLPDGRILVNGGLSAGRTSIYDPGSGLWTNAALMNIPRAYQGTAPLYDGSVLTLGGSWAGGVGHKDGELWTEAAGWRRLPGVPIDPFLSVDPTRDFGMDSHLWLLPAGNGRVLHAGPGMNMNWIDTAGDGRVTAIGPRGDDEFSINGNAAMYDVGKVLKVCGAPGYDGTTANANAYVIEVGATVNVRKIQPLAYQRAFENAVVLPNGQVVVIGGATIAVGFSDSNAVLAPELFDPVTETFVALPPMSVPRNYHSVALLLPDGRVLSGGGGLCGDGCAANHPDLQILSPPYLFNPDGTPATRPVILGAPAAASHGTSVQVTTDGPIAAFALLRLSSNTHTLNNDQRRLPLSFHATGASNVYALDIPSNPGWAVPGLYMLFAINDHGVPSVSATIRIGSPTPLRLQPVPDQTATQGSSLSLALLGSSPTGATLTYAATGLPPGLTVNPTGDPSTGAGVIAGVPSTGGTYWVEVSVSDGTQRTSTQFAWVVSASTATPLLTLAQPAPAALAVGVGAPVTLALMATGPVGDALTYAAAGLPPGLALDPQTGVISGTTTTAGSYAVDATVSDAAASAVAVANVHFTWFVGLPPPVVDAVVAPIVASGSNVSYTASATGSGSLQYQWTFQNGDGTSAGGGGFTDAPTTAHLFATAGVFTVTLTVRNSDGAASVQQFVQAVSASSPAPPGTTPAPRASGNLTLEPRAGQGARLWAVNLDGDSVSVFDATSRAKLAEIAVGSRPRAVAVAPDGEVWVTNKGSGTLSVIDPARLAVTRTIALPRAAQPFGVVFGADGGAFVALEATGQVVKIDGAGTGAVIATLDVGPNPRHLALTPAGDHLLVPRFITRPQPGEGTAVVQTTVAGMVQGADTMIVDPTSLTSTGQITLQHSDKPDTTISARGVPNYLGAPAIAPDGQSAWIPSKQDNIQRGRLRDGHDLDFQDTVRAISSRIDLQAQAEDYGARIDHDNAGVASAAAYHPSGVYLFVTLESSRQLAVVDAYGRRELFRADTGRAPQAVVVSADGGTLYVHNALDRSVGVYDLTPLVARGQTTLPLVATLASVAVETLTPQVLLGKQLFYDARDPRLARDGYLSCASCHNDGGFDGRTWDLTSLGEGLRNTIALRGRAGGQGRLHWSGNFDEVQDFEGQIRALGQGTGLMSDAAFATGTRSQPLGDTKAGLSADLDALAAYVGSLSTFAPSPYRDPTGALTAGAVAGRAVFASQCTACHGGDAFTDSDTLVAHDVGTLKPSSGQRLGGPLTGIDTPTLRDVWATAPYLHDGSAASVEAAIAAHTNLALSAGDLSNVAAFTRQIGAEESAVAASAPTTTPPTTTGGGLTAQYFSNATLAGAPALTRVEAIDFDWGYDAPAPGLPADGFSVRWTGQVSAPATGTYVFQTVSDDGVRLWINGTLMIDDWNDHGATTDRAAGVTLVAGISYDVKMEYYEDWGGAVARLGWQTPGSAAFVAVPGAQLHPAGGQGLLGQYFSNATLAGTPALTRTEAVDFDWGYDVPAPGLPSDNFSVRWTGRVSATIAGSYLFQTLSDDGVRLWIDGALVIDNWNDHGPTTDNAAPLALAAGQSCAIKLEYYEHSGGAVARLRWQIPGATTAVPIPVGQLYGN